MLPEAEKIENNSFTLKIPFAHQKSASAFGSLLYKWPTDYIKLEDILQ